jgi:hypothetical protein
MQHALRGTVARSFEARGRERRWGLRRVGEGGLSRVRREEDEDGSRVTRQEGSGRCGWASREGERRLDEKLFVGACEMYVGCGGLEYVPGHGDFEHDVLRVGGVWVG